MDRSQKYRKFIIEYIDGCKAANYPLNECQIGLLEKLVESNPDLAAQTSYHPCSSDNRLDIATLIKVASENHMQRPQRLVNAIKEFKYGEKDPNINVIDADALELYNFVEEEIKHRNLREIKKNHPFPRGFGISSLALLHAYLQDRGLIDESKERPREPRYL